MKHIVYVVEGHEVRRFTNTSGALDYIRDELLKGHTCEVYIEYVNDDEYKQIEAAELS